MRYRGGRKNPHTIYRQLGDQPDVQDIPVGYINSRDVREILVGYANQGIAIGRLTRAEVAAAIESDYLAHTTDSVWALLHPEPS